MTTRRFLMWGAATLALSLGVLAVAQQAPIPYVRWAELEVDPVQLNAFKVAASENAAATVRTEPGVLAFNSAAEKGNPGRIRVLEIYADADAYLAHVESPHFKKFARETQKMITARRLFDAVPVLLGAKPQLPLTPLVRVAELEIDPAQIDAYKAAVVEEIEASIRVEPGVLAIYSVALKDNPTHLRFFEIYADESAYRQHIESPHFKKYVETTKSMITARKLVETESPTLGLKGR